MRFLCHPKTFISLLFLLPLFAAAQQPLRFGFAPEALCSHAKCAHLRPQSGTTVSHPYTSRYDAVYYRCEWEIDPAVNAISGGITLYFRPNQPTDSIFTDLAANMLLDSVYYQGAMCAFTRMGNSVGAILPSPVAANMLDSVTFFYHGVPASSGFGSFFQEMRTDGSHTLWTLSEPYGASDWWPCKNTTNDKADSIDILVRTPVAYRTASNGLLLTEDTLPGGTHRLSHWRHRHPITAYLVAIAVANYASYTEYAQIGATALPVLNMVYPEELADWQINTGASVAQLELYSDLFIPYPFLNEKYGHAQFGWGGGMEHQTMSFMGGSWYSLQAHELAHQWFGDYITCGSFRDIWLNEGFATLLEGLAYEHLDAQWWPLWKYYTRQDAMAPSGSVYVDDTTNVNRIFSGSLTYAKGAMVLHQLRGLMGDSAFYAGIHNYLNDPALAGKYALTRDLQAHLEQAHGQSLQFYFDDWIYGQGFPTYDIIWLPDTAGNVWVQLQQAQSHPSVAFFELPVPIQFSDGAGWDTTVTFFNSTNGEWFSFPCAHEVDTVIFDPEIWLLAQAEVTEVITQTHPAVRPEVLLAPNPAQGRVRVTAATPIANVEITDLSGKTAIILPGNNLENLEIDLSALRKGVYLAHISTSRGTTVQKLVIR